MTRSEQLAAQIEPFDSFWEGPEAVQDLPRSVLNSISEP